MPRTLKAILVCAIIPLIVMFVFFLFEANGTSYTPPISTSEMETLSYNEVLELMNRRGTETSKFESLQLSINNTWFWKNLFSNWLILFLSCLFTLAVWVKLDQK